MNAPKTDIRVAVQIDADVMRRLGQLARARGISVQEMITSVLTDVAQGADGEATEPPAAALPGFLSDDHPTDVIRGRRLRPSDIEPSDA